MVGIRRRSMTLHNSRRQTDLAQALSKSSNRNKWALRLSRIFRQQDLFGQHVHLTYKGKKTYKTNIGAFVSIILKAILAAYIIYEFYVIFSRKHPAVSTKYIISPAALDGEGDAAWSLKESGFDIAIQFFQSSTTIQDFEGGTVGTDMSEPKILDSIDPEYGQLIAKYIKKSHKT
jgi:hypothetical protein